MYGNRITTDRFSRSDSNICFVRVNFRLIVDCTIPTGKPLSTNNLCKVASSPSILFAEQMLIARCTSVAINLIFIEFGQNESHFIDSPVNEGLRYTSVDIISSFLLTRTSRKLSLFSHSFSLVNFNASCTVFNFCSKVSQSASLLKTANHVPAVEQRHAAYLHDLCLMVP